MSLPLRAQMNPDMDRGAMAQLFADVVRFLLSGDEGGSEVATARAEQN
jgi:hypothetical protein